MGSPKFFLVAALLAIPAWAQSPTYGLGKAPTAEEMRAWDIAISPTGKELPQGQGTAKDGATLYVRKGCAGCHGANGSGGHAPVLISRKGPQPPPSVPCLAPCVNDSNSMGCSLPLRDRNLGLHQSRHAFRERGQPHAPTKSTRSPPSCSTRMK
jgi:hypothetical protein